VKSNNSESNMTDIDTTRRPAVRMQQPLSGFAVSPALYVVAELGVATAPLSGPRTVSELGSALHSAIEATFIG
jgi:hypothetical protein